MTRRSTLADAMHCTQIVIPSCYYSERRSFSFDLRPATSVDGPAYSRFDI